MKLVVNRLEDTGIFVPEKRQTDKQTKQLQANCKPKPRQEAF